MRVRSLFVISLFSFTIFSNCSSQEITDTFNYENYSQIQIYSDFEVIIKSFILRRDFNDRKYLSNISDIVLIPQEYAVISGDKVILEELFNFWVSMIPNIPYIQSMDPFSSGLIRLSIIRSLSNFLRGLVENNHEEYLNVNFEILVQFVRDEVIYFSKINNPGWPPLTDGDIRERIIFALTNWKKDKNGDRLNYEYSINDDLWRLIESAANIYVVENALSDKSSMEIKEVIDLGYRFINELGEFNETGWHFQLGSINDHPDNIYSGYSKIEEINGPKTIEKLGWDTSHFSMFPSMLNALIKAFENNSSAKNSLINIRNKLSDNFYSNIIHWINGNPFTVNYMDGSNGLYRYNPSTNDAYLPFETSGTILFGQWAYLKSNIDSKFYKDLFDCFPLPASTIKTYQSLFLRENRININQVEALYEKEEIRIFSFMASKINN